MFKALAEGPRWRPSLKAFAEGPRWRPSLEEKTENTGRLLLFNLALTMQVALRTKEKSEETNEWESIFRKLLEECK